LIFRMRVTEIIKRHERKYPVRKSTIEISRPTFLRGINTGGNLFLVEFRCACGYKLCPITRVCLRIEAYRRHRFYNLFMVGVIELFPHETNNDSKKIKLKNCARRCTLLSFLAHISHVRPRRKSQWRR